MGKNTRLRLVFSPTLLSCSIVPLPACFTTEHSTVETSLFVKLNELQNGGERGTNGLVSYKGSRHLNRNEAKSNRGKPYVE